MDFNPGYIIFKYNSKYIYEPILKCKEWIDISPKRDMQKAHNHTKTWLKTDTKRKRKTKMTSSVLPQWWLYQRGR